LFVLRISKATLLWLNAARNANKTHGDATLENLVARINDSFI